MRCILSILLFSISIVLPYCALANDGWSCSNNEMEITCHDEKCNFAGKNAFTPTDLSIVPGYMSYCAYSGCWRGVPYITSTEKSFYGVGTALRWIHENGANDETVQIAIDTAKRRGVVLGGGFAMPVKCEPWKCGEDCKSSLSGN